MRKLTDWLKYILHPQRKTSPEVAREDEDLDLNNPYPEPVVIEIEDVFDLHTIAPRDVRRAVEAYIVEAHRAGFRSVRIIHGKGIGVQRRAVREVLAASPLVIELVDAPPQAGGLGATIAHLRRDHEADKLKEQSQG